MNHLLNTNKKTLLYSIMSWLIPFTTSIFLYNPETKQFLPSFEIFKIIMLMILNITTYIFYKKLKKDSPETFNISIPNTFTLTNILLDLLVLIILLKMDITLWIWSVLPIYLISFYILNGILFNQIKFKASKK